MFDTIVSTLEQEIQRVRNAWNGKKPRRTIITSLAIIQCPFGCGKGPFRRQVDIRVHLERSHDVTISQYQGRQLQPVPCYKCDKNFNLTSLAKHYRIDHDNDH